MGKRPGNGKTKYACVRTKAKRKASRTQKAGHYFRCIDAVDAADVAVVVPESIHFCYTAPTVFYSMLLYNNPTIAQSSTHSGQKAAAHYYAQLNHA